jgi:hypothetical protein
MSRQASCNEEQVIFSFHLANICFIKPGETS